MQIVKLSFFIVLILIFAQSKDCSKSKVSSNDFDCKLLSSNSNSSLGNKDSNQNKKEDLDLEYEVLTKDCFTKDSCLAFIYVKKELIDDESLLRLTNKLNALNESKNLLILAFFDDINLARFHAEGKREPRDVERDAIAIFRQDKEKAFLRIKESVENKSKWRTICSIKF